MDCATQTVSADTAKKLFAIVSTIDKQPTLRRILDADPQGVAPALAQTELACAEIREEDAVSDFVWDE